MRTTLLRRLEHRLPFQQRPSPSSSISLLSLPLLLIILTCPLFHTLPLLSNCTAINPFTNSIFSFWTLDDLYLTYGRSVIYFSLCNGNILVDSKRLLSSSNQITVSFNGSSITLQSDQGDPNLCGSPTKTTITLKCGLTMQLNLFDNTNPCYYFFQFTTPDACQCKFIDNSHQLYFDLFYLTELTREIEGETYTVSICNPSKSAWCRGSYFCKGETVLLSDLGVVGFASSSNRSIQLSATNSSWGGCELIMVFDIVCGELYTIVSVVVDGCTVVTTLSNPVICETLAVSSICDALQIGDSRCNSFVCKGSALSDNSYGIPPLWFLCRNFTSVAIALRVSHAFSFAFVPTLIYPKLQMFQYLTDLDLSDNLLKGTIPNLIGMVTKLTKIDLARNFLTGTIPSSLTELSLLSYLDLSSNEISGTLPVFLANMKLLTLDLSENSITGTIPSSYIIQNLDLSMNMLTGTIPSILLYSDTESLNLSQNNLEGTLPNELGVSNLNLASNLITGTFPVFNFSKAIGITLEHNMISGTLPSTTWSHLSLLTAL